MYVIIYMIGYNPALELKWAWTDGLQRAPAHHVGETGTSQDGKVLALHVLFLKIGPMMVSGQFYFKPLLEILIGSFPVFYLNESRNVKGLQVFTRAHDYL